MIFGRKRAGGAAAASPCTGVCRMEAAGPYCLGCRRTLDEIVAWRDLDEAGRRRILAELPLRPPAAEA
ncbi:MAG TPA: DUF1289 domain-containing protein [Alphaproteobacteria bacterium]|nr:DUF1289 domain-containing protein [Alphaproteobacteria bacterium]